METMSREDGRAEAGRLTKEGIFDKVMYGQHLTSEEKEFVLNGYRPVPTQMGAAVHRDEAEQSSSTAVA